MFAPIRGHAAPLLSFHLQKNMNRGRLLASTQGHTAPSPYCSLQHKWTRVACLRQSKDTRRRRSTPLAKNKNGSLAGVHLGMHGIVALLPFARQNSRTKAILSSCSDHVQQNTQNHPSSSLTHNFSFPLTRMSSQQPNPDPSSPPTYTLVAATLFWCSSERVSGLRSNTSIIAPLSA